MRRFGFRIFYGDATRLDLLHAAGASRKRSCVIVDAIDDVEANLRLVDIVRQHFPHLVIVARARHVGHLDERRKRKVDLVDRALFESALSAGRRALRGPRRVRPHEAYERAARFRRHNLALLESLGSEALGEEQRTARARAARDELERQFQMDRDEIERLEGGDWQSERASEP